MPIYNWATDKEDIINRLEAKAPLKLAVKLLDEPLLIRSWIEHHAKIVGFGNLIVADNGSTDEATLDIYREFSDRVTIFRFEGNHNLIHWHPRFTELFRVIRRSSRYFAFIDVDERLVWLDENEWFADASIVEKLPDNLNSGIIPTTWLLNTLNSFDTFSFLDSEGREIFENNLKWGKPIFPSFLAGIQSGIHNAQFDRFEFLSKLGHHFFLLHLTKFPERRISASRHKILSRGVIQKDTGIDVIMSMNFADHPDKTLIRFVSEIKEMTRILKNPSDYVDFGKLGTLKFGHGGLLEFSSESGKSFLKNFLANGTHTIRRLFGGDDQEEGLSNDASKLLEFALESRNRGPQERAEVLFRRGMAIYPDFLDKYGDPAFKKELMRMLLARAEWAKAEELMPKQGEPGGNFWHQILFARAFFQNGDKDKATFWWEKVLANDPKNAESERHLAGK